MKRPAWCPQTSKIKEYCDELCLDCLKAKTEDLIETTAIKTSLQEPVEELIRAMVENEFPEDERHA